MGKKVPEGLRTGSFDACVEDFLGVFGVDAGGALGEIRRRGNVSMDIALFENSGDGDIRRVSVCLFHLLCLRGMLIV